MRFPSRRVSWTVAALAIALLAWLLLRGRGAEVRYVTAPVDRGDVQETVGATGALQAVVTVQVGSQVSGTIQELNADFNSMVKAGQVIARLDPSTFEARVAQARANLTAARANVERARATVEDTRQKYERAQELSSQQLVAVTDLETARSNFEGAKAALDAARAAVEQSAAALKQADVDLRHTVIDAPIDGVVIARNVDVGQTVAASLQAPTLFVIANDLTQMQVNASIDEADVGRVKAGQEAAFRVDAYPERTFRGEVAQVRLQPTTNQNVVSYSTIVNVPNPRQLLMPGMTASVSIVVERREDVLRVPASALRFRPAGGAREGARPSPRSAPAGSRSGGGGAAARERGAPREDGGRAATLYAPGAKGPEPRKVVVGVSDGQVVEVKEGLAEGDAVITGVEGEAGAAARSGPQGAGGSNPFNPQFQRRQR